MKARTKKFGTRAVAMLLSAMTTFSMFLVSAGAAQVNSYHDPAEHWMQASGRTNATSVQHRSAEAAVKSAKISAQAVGQRQSGRQPCLNERQKPRKRC